MLTSRDGTFQSLNYPDYYSNNLNVCWLISAENHILTWFTYFNTERKRDFVRLHDGQSNSSHLLLEDSGYKGPSHKEPVVTLANQMFVVFTSNFNNTNDVKYEGFNASYTSCTVLTSISGEISSPNYPNNYNTLQSVCWVVSQPDDYNVTLSFHDFHTEPNWDMVRIFDGNSTNSPLLLAASGNVLPFPVTSTSNQMLIVFNSDNVWVYPGFQASYYSILDTTTEQPDTTTETSAPQETSPALTTTDSTTISVPITTVTTTAPSSAVTTSTPNPIDCCLYLLLMTLLTNKYFH